MGFMNGAGFTLDILLSFSLSTSIWELPTLRSEVLGILHSRFLKLGASCSVDAFIRRLQLLYQSSLSSVFEVKTIISRRVSLLCTYPPLASASHTSTY